METDKFIKYLASINFPNENYNAVYSYPNTKLINKKYMNDFTKKYKKKFLYPHEDKNIILETESNKLFNESFKYVSSIQKNLFKKKIDNYISGGSALKLYSLFYNVKDNNKIFTTSDYDIYIYYDDKDDKSSVSNKLDKSSVSNKLDKSSVSNNSTVSNKLDKSNKLNRFNITILNNVKNIINSILEFNKYQNYAFLELYIIINYIDINTLYIILKTFLNDNFDLYTYVVKDNNIYDFKFLKIINKEFCIRIKIRCADINYFIQEGIYSYTKITYYYIKKLPGNVFKILNKYIPIEILTKNKTNSNLELMKSTINLYNNKFYIYNLNTILYNLMHLYYKYNHSENNYQIQLKKDSGKDIRDKKRLDLFFIIYCKGLYSELNKSLLNRLLNKLKDNEVNFKKSVEKINNFDMIENIFNSK